MSYPFPPELDKLVKQQLATGEFKSEDELLLTALRTLEVEQSDWAAIEESLKSLDYGDQGVSLEEAFAVVRQRHNIPQDA
jgi:Arc/MetJ-type ribon-helix-helix transcriptional regulator